MNSTQISQVQTQVDLYFDLDIAKLVGQAYPDKDLNEIVISTFTLKEFLSLSNKVFNQFKEELKNTYFKSLPFQYNYHNEFGSGNLNTDLTQYVNFVKTSNFAHSVTVLQKLIHYQALNGFWEKSKRKYFRHSEEAVNSEKERIEIVSEQLDSATKTLEGLLSEIATTKSELELFTETKKKEITEIEALLAASRTHGSEITELHSGAISTSEKINSMVDVADTKIADIGDTQQDIRKDLKNLQSTVENRVQSINIQEKEYLNLSARFNTLISTVEEKTTYFEERNSYLDDLIGREVGASLFETFKQRKAELNTSITFWKWCVPITALATIIWIFVLFGNGDLGALGWQVIFINSLKAIPAVGLLLFAISQYNKERNFQEEYAFKSAVALTVNSYADQINAESNKDKMVMESVGEIYKTPLSRKNNQANEAKTLIGTARELTDVAKSLVDKK